MVSRWFTFLLLILVLIALTGEVAFIYWHERQPRENRFDPIIASVAREDGMDPFLIRALIWRESKFDPLTHGAADERGLMQVTPDAGERWAKANKIPNFQANDLFDPITNIRAGTWYLRRSMHLWEQVNVDDPIPFALAEYNAGRSNALKWVDPTAPTNHNAFLQNITFPLTRKYVDTILKQREVYRVNFANSPSYRDFAATLPPVTKTP